MSPAHTRSADRMPGAVNVLVILVVLLFTVWTTAGRDLLRQRGLIPPAPEQVQTSP
jgi:hypothetical protein